LKKAVCYVFIFIFCAAAAARAGTGSKAAKYYNYGLKYHKQKQYKNAITYYNAAVKTNRKFWQAWLGLGICYYSLKKYRNARLIFRYVLSLKPGQKTAVKYYSVLAPSQKKKRKEKKEGKPKTKVDMMWRSALLPGLGQFYNGEAVKGYVYSLSFLASAGAIVKYTIDQNRAVTEYENTNYNFDKKYSAAEEARWKVFIPAGMAALAWSMSIIDALITGEDAEETGRGYRSRVKMAGENTLALNIVRVEF